MGIKNDNWITYMAQYNDMIVPFIPYQETLYGISYGLSSCGYDIRTTDEWLVADPDYKYIIRPGSFNAKAFKSYKSGTIVIPPYGFVLACSVEKFIIPENVSGECVGKSTLARCGIAVHTTPLEPGWQGQLTIELSNTTPWKIELHAGTGVAQVRFTLLSAKPSITYADREGKYQNQEGIVLARNG